ncbi:MAG: isoprenyl transferase [Clostridia bacterium]|nr:isoprenyl transferase [Clostridia bacterium]
MALFGKDEAKKELGLLTPEDIRRLPRHVGIIMDGNGRWAVRRGMPRSFGHKAGVEALRAIIRRSSDLGIEALTIYAFSTENWSRSVEEVSALMGLLLEYFTKELDELHREHVCIRIIGDISGMPKGLERQQAALYAAMDRTRENTGLKLNIALNYGSQQEIVRAAQNLARRAAAGELAPEQITREMFAGELYTAGLPDVDFLIRTSGELRLSNFLLYQCAYAEFYKTDILWPDFDRNAYDEALLTYTKRERRFGGVK